MAIFNIIHKLTGLGFKIWADDGNVRFEHTGEGEPPQAETVAHLLEEFKTNKAEVIRQLKIRAELRKLFDSELEPILNRTAEAVQIVKPTELIAFLRYTLLQSLIDLPELANTNKQRFRTYSEQLNNFNGFKAGEEMAYMVDFWFRLITIVDLNRLPNGRIVHHTKSRIYTIEGVLLYE